MIEAAIKLVENLRRQRTAIVRVIKAYDRDHPLRTADQHHTPCECMRCAIDELRAL